jgi:hypothetical protein
MITFSKYAIESMGYEMFPDTDVLHIHFGIIHVYSIQGMNFEQTIKDKLSQVIHISEQCSLVVAQSINEGTEILAGDKFFDGDEEKWLADKQYQPPFLVIFFRESKSRELIGGYRKKVDDAIHIHDGFPEGKKEIKDWEEETLPTIVTALTVNLSTLDHQVKLIPLERSIFGTTKDEETVFDVKLTFSGTATVSRSKSLEEINLALDKSKILQNTLTKDTCRNFYVALNEKDRMKQFLGYFQFIERYTHSSYKLLAFDGNSKQMFNIPKHLDESIFNFFKRNFEESKTLSTRFHWCSIMIWGNIGDDDVACFIDAKKVRDKLSHGEAILETEIPVEATKKLALKLLGTE